MKRLLLALLPLAILNCTDQPDTIESRTEHCKALLQESEEYMKEESYFSAREPLLAIQHTCTGTGFMEQSQYLLAESYFHAEDWVEARAEYSLFAEQYPSSPQAPLAAYRQGYSAYKIEYVPGRDNANTSKAIRDFNVFVSNHPENVKVDSAKYYISTLVERLANEKMAIAILYSRMSEPQATAIYLKEFLKTYPQSIRTQEALELLVNSYIRLEQFEQAREFLSHLGTRFPEKSKDSYSSLDSELKNAIANFDSSIENKQSKKKRKIEKASE